ncbi:MAG: hypothetical protein RBT80_16770 [Candidatus Vecturithrix sp.]|nr:hypothetical protein [Candidatus Vecturithrix sp.]
MAKLGFAVQQSVQRAGNVNWAAARSTTFRLPLPAKAELWHS